ncbi:hypothetical protein LAZ67_2005843 [Cordylochernes scorpioides]|uniref:Transposable element Tcb2 transposase n=1 Tax=Cordylochernes scorpioides TaxID=51811 RepID=A0ABY6K821_9ARAC|nr:hypothetical protein LAZ67_2005843 [Cordylochernes scorpioides]
MEAGQSQAEVARWLGVTRNVVSRLWKNIQTAANVARTPEKGRPRVTTLNKDRYLSLLVRRNRRTTASQLRSDLNAATGVLVSTDTIRRRLHRKGLYARRPIICVPLTPPQKRARKLWCRQHVAWNPDEWRRVMFTDESRFSLNSDSRRVFVWRERYRDEILAAYVMPQPLEMEEKFLLMDDNARPHRAGVVDTFLQNHAISRMNWPARSPDLNPIEHVWDNLGRRISSLQPPPRNTHELETALTQEWALIPQELINSLIPSMGHRCRACLSVELMIDGAVLVEWWVPTGEITSTLGWDRTWTLRKGESYETGGDRYLVVTAKRHREMTAIQLSNGLSSDTGTRISRQTVYRRLHEGALYARRPMVCIPLTSAHRRARLNWGLEHHAWTHDQWANVLFSDESRFSLNTDSRRVFICREPGTRYHPSNTREIDSFRGGSLLVWAGISSSRRTPLHIFSGGTLTAQRYRDEILEPYLRHYRDHIGHNFIFIDDNARPHRARLVNEYLQSENIRRMDWPARSPDLNPIEHAWDALGKRIGARHPSPRTLVELGTALLEELGLLPLDLLQSLVNSMRARCETLIAVRGNAISVPASPIPHTLFTQKPLTGPERDRGKPVSAVEAEIVDADYSSLSELGRASRAQLHRSGPTTVFHSRNLVEGTLQISLRRFNLNPDGIAKFPAEATESITFGGSDPFNRADIFLSEVEAAIRRLSKGKAAGWDSIPCKLVQQKVNEGIKFLRQEGNKTIINRIINTRKGTILKLPNDQNIDQLIASFKKHDEINQISKINKPKLRDPTILVKSINKITDITNLVSIICEMNPELAGLNNEIKVLFPIKSVKAEQDVVLRGGPISPTIWNIILNDLLDSYSESNSEIIAYADDIIVICWENNLTELRNTTGKVMGRILDWCGNNKLTVSEEKTKILYLFNSKIAAKIPNTITANRVEKLKIMRITFKNHRNKNKLDFVPHIEEIITKTNRASGYLIGLTGKAWGLDSKRRIVLYKTLFRSSLTYGSTIWYNFIPKKVKDKLNSLQYKILKHSTQVYNSTSSNCTHIVARTPKLTDFIETNILKINIRYKKIRFY